MRRTILLSGISVIGGIVLAGCGGSSNSTPVATTTEITKSVYGFVYVKTDLAPTGSPNVVVTNTTTPPAGYAVPTSGSVTLSVANGEVSRATSLVFNMATDTNLVVAKVRSVTALGGTPSFSVVGSGLVYNDGIPTTPDAGPFTLASSNFSMGGAGDTQVITVGSAAYTPGPAASLKVLLRDNSIVGSKFGAPATVIGDIIPGNRSQDFYDVIILAADANGVLISPSNTNYSVTDNFGGSDYAPVSFSGFATRGGPSNSLQAFGGGVEGDDVTLSFSRSDAPGLSLNFVTNYSYGNEANFSVNFTNPSSTATVLWPASGPVNTVPLAFTILNPKNVAVPNRAYTLEVRNTNGTNFASNNYPSPAAGSALTSSSGSTNGSGNATSTFNTPTSAAGSGAFNSLNIKYGSGTTVAVIGSGGIIGGRSIIITRPLGALAVSGASRLDTGTTSPATTATTNADRFRISTADDIDGQSVLAESTFATLLSNVSWSITNIPSATAVSGFPNPAGDLDDTAVRSVSAASFNGSSTGVSVRMNAGSAAGRFTAVVSSGSVLSTPFVVDVFGVPQKVKLTTTSGGVSPTAGGFTGIANGGSITVTPAFIDTFGHVIPTGELSFGTSNGSVASGPGGTIIPAGGRDYTVTRGNATTIASITYNAITWTGAKGGSGSNSITRTFNVAP